MTPKPKPLTTSSYCPGVEQAPTQKLEDLPCHFSDSPPLIVPQFLPLQNGRIGLEIFGAVPSAESLGTRVLKASSQLLGTQGAFDGGRGGNAE